MNRFVVSACSLLALCAIATGALWFTYQEEAEAHCQVPCGIYDDSARITALREDATTIGKAVTQIGLLSGKHDALSFNQATRWVMTKETHASNIIKVISEYFLTQKVKTVAPGAPGYDPYLKKLADHHAVLAAAMKTKQTTDPANVEALRKAIDTLAHHYKAPPKSADAGPTPETKAVALRAVVHDHNDLPAGHTH